MHCIEEGIRDAYIKRLFFFSPGPYLDFPLLQGQENPVVGPGEVVLWAPLLLIEQGVKSVERNLPCRYLDHTACTVWLFMSQTYNLMVQFSGFM